MVLFIFGMVLGYLIGMYMYNQKFKDKVNSWLKK